MGFWGGIFIVVCLLFFFPLQFGFGVDGVFLFLFFPFYLPPFFSLFLCIILEVGYGLRDQVIGEGVYYSVTVWKMRCTKEQECRNQLSYDCLRFSVYHISIHP